MTLHQILEEAEKEFKQMFWLHRVPKNTKESDYVNRFLHSTSIKLIEAIIEQMKGAKGEGALRLNTFLEGYKDGHNSALDHQISLLTEQLLAIKGK